MDKKELVKKYLSQYAPALATDEIISKFVLLMQELIEWNQKFNLTSITDETGIVIRHFIDSLQPEILGITSQYKTIIDIGTGAGFPGIPLAIANKKLKVFLMESNGKKIKFLKHMVETLGQDNIFILEGRAEDFSRKYEHRDKYDAVIMRAISNFNIAMEISCALVKHHGQILFYASGKQKEEISDEGKLYRELKLEMAHIEDYELPENYGNHSIIILDKLLRTPDKYPRVYNMIKAKPLV
ncbi:MAG: 16S rRNA (guanine(527)-N(7))-methyltransferase RsmG [bacterium]